MNGGLKIYRQRTFFRSISGPTLQQKIQFTFRKKKLPQQKTDDIQQIKHEKTANFFLTQKKVEMP